MDFLRFPPLSPFSSCFRLLLICLVALLFAFMWSSDTLPLNSVHRVYHHLFNQSGANVRARIRFRPPGFDIQRVRPSQTTTPQTTAAQTTASQTTAPQTTPPPPPHQAYAPQYRFTWDQPDACREPPFLLLMVPVAPKNKEAREAIRQTWGKEGTVRGEKVLTLFMLGQAEADPQSMETEKQLHHDLLQSDFIDSYLNLTIKTMVIMHWVATRCSNATFAMKVDSDMFLNVENLVDMLKKPEVPRQNYLTGHLMWNRPVIRDKNSKWYVSEELYPEPLYPTYALGAAYVFSCDLPGRFVEASKNIRPFNIEDAYIGMCMKKLGQSLTSPPDPGQFQAYNSQYNRCRFSQVITYILGSSQQLLQYWSDLKKPGPPCP